MTITKKEILDILKERKQMSEIKSDLGLEKSENKSVRQLIKKLEVDGDIEKIKEGKTIYYKIKNSHIKKTDKSGNFFKRLLEFKYALIIILFVVLIQAYLLSQLKQIPGPVYGGDLYNHFGHILHIYNGNFPWKSSIFLEEYEHYPWLMHLIVALIAKITAVDPMAVTILFPIIITVLGGIITYLIGKKIFKDEKFALISCFAWILPIPATHPNNFSLYLIMPLFLLSILYAENLVSRIFAGICYGLTGLSYVSAFLGASLFISLLLLRAMLTHVKLCFDTKKMKISCSIDDNDKIKASLKKNIIFFAPIVLIGLCIAMLYWAPPIFVYHGETLNPWQEYTMTQGAGGELIDVGYVISTIEQVLFNVHGVLSPVFAPSIQNILLSFFSVIVIIGVYTGIKQRQNRNMMIIILFSLAGFLGAFHPLITEPLIHRSFGHYGFANVFFPLTKSLFFVIGIFNTYNWIKEKNTRAVLLCAVCLFLILSLWYSVDSYTNDRWVKEVGMKEQSPSVKNMSEWVNKNTGINDVFLTLHDETAFALNALTGRKAVMYRRTHASNFVDVNARIADASIIMYGNDTNKMTELLRKYKVSYVYIEGYSTYSMDTCMRYWQKMSELKQGDPTIGCLLTSPENRDYLYQYGVEFIEVKSRLDPANANAPKFDMLAIYPRLTKEFANKLKEEVTFDDGSKIMKVLYAN